MSSPRGWSRVAGAVAPALALASCGGVDEVIPPRVVIDAAAVDAPVDAWVDAPSDGVTALPDIVLVESQMAGSIHITDQTFAAEDCEIVEGCVGGTGVRRLLRFSTVTANQGTGDLYLGNPEGNPLFEFSACHGHHHFLGYALYELVDGNGTLVTGNKQAFCLLDSVQVEPGSPGPKYTCELQGISAGWADSYPYFLPCQWLDITGLTPGEYTLRVSVNPDQILPETDYGNNVLSIPVTF
jgi:hypothetical protein